MEKFGSLNFVTTFGVLTIFFKKMTVKNKNIENRFFPQKGQSFNSFVSTKDLEKIKPPTKPQSEVGVFCFISFGEDHVRNVSKKDKTLWIFFSTMKNVFGQKNKITQQDLKAHCGNALPYSYETARKFMTQLVKANYAAKCNDGYILLSVKKVANEKFGVPIGFRFRYIQGESKKEVLARVYYNIFQQNVKKQCHEHHKDKGMAATKRTVTAALRSGMFSVGVRWFAELANLNSPISGTFIEKDMEALGLVKIKRQTTEVCDASLKHQYVWCNPEDEHKLFEKDGKVFRRELNEIKCLA